MRSIGGGSLSARGASTLQRPPGMPGVSVEAWWMFYKERLQEDPAAVAARVNRQATLDAETSNRRIRVLEEELRTLRQQLVMQDNRDVEAAARLDADLRRLQTEEREMLAAAEAVDRELAVVSERVDALKKRDAVARREAADLEVHRQSMSLEMMGLRGRLQGLKCGIA
mmetsp:Transcript_9242/g.20013  ORF Transcript_9242/g.20013 Transcript_9242/m.20013 type:complete len:169 (+) Transcript_9242:33-539(+)